LNNIDHDDDDDIRLLYKGVSYIVSMFDNVYRHLRWQICAGSIPAL